jgi:hypothetical protein
MKPDICSQARCRPSHLQLLHVDGYRKKNQCHHPWCHFLAGGCITDAPAPNEAYATGEAVDSDQGGKLCLAFYDTGSQVTLATHEVA